MFYLDKTLIFASGGSLGTLWGPTCTSRNYSKYAAKVDVESPSAPQWAASERTSTSRNYRKYRTKWPLEPAVYALYAVYPAYKRPVRYRRSK